MADEQSSSPESRNLQELRAFQEEVANAIELGQALETMGQAVNRVQSQISAKGFQMPPIKLMIPGGADMIDEDDYVHEGVTEFVADRIMSFSSRGIEFGSWQTRERLTINHTDFYFEPIESDIDQPAAS